jgi:hypothetical protein
MTPPVFLLLQGGQIYYLFIFKKTLCSCNYIGKKRKKKKGPPRDPMLAFYWPPPVLAFFCFFLLSSWPMPSPSFVLPRNLLFSSEDW